MPRSAKSLAPCPTPAHIGDARRSSATSGPYHRLFENPAAGVVEVRAAGDKTVSSLRFRGRARKSGVEVNAPFAQVATWRDGRVALLQHFGRRRKPSKPWGCRSRRCRRRTWSSRGGPGNSGARALTTRSLGDSHPTWSGTTRSASELRRRASIGGARKYSNCPQRFATRSMWLVSKSRTCATSPPPRSWFSGAFISKAGGSGAAVTTPFGSVTEVRDGLAVRQRFWTDQGKALEAAGLSE